MKIATILKFLFLFSVALETVTAFGDSDSYIKTGIQVYYRPTCLSYIRVCTVQRVYLYRKKKEEKKSHKEILQSRNKFMGVLRRAFG